MSEKCKHEWRVFGGDPGVAHFICALCKARASASPAPHWRWETFEEWNADNTVRGLVVSACKDYLGDGDLEKLLNAFGSLAFAAARETKD